MVPAKGEVCVESFELPKLGPRQVLLQTLYSTISPGTELAFIHHLPGTPGTYPVWLRYTACCRVLKVGKEASSIEVGQVVVARSPHASLHILDAGQCYALPKGLSPRDASA